MFSGGKMDKLFVKEEVESILPFIETISIKNIQSFWEMPEISILDFKGNDDIELNYEGNFIQTTDGRASKDYESLKKAKEFIMYLIQKGCMYKRLAEKIISIDEFYIEFNCDSVLVLLFNAERYRQCVDYFERHTTEFCDSQKAIEIAAVSKRNTGNFSPVVISFVSNSIDSELEKLRFLWQKGDFSSALDLITYMDGRINIFNIKQKGFYLNDKIRVYRDMGRIQETNKYLDELYGVTMEAIQESEELFKKLEGKYLYNYAIDRYVKGDFENCISSCEQSLARRDTAYSKPYILLRKARCYIFRGKRAQYQKLMKEISIESYDKWAQSLYFTVISEYNRFILNNEKKAIEFLEKSHELEVVNGSAIKYTDIALLYLHIQCNNKNDIILYMNKMDNYIEYIDAKLAKATAQIALKLINGESHADLEISRLFNSEPYKSYNAFLFVSLFSLAKLCERLNVDFPLNELDMSCMNQFSKRLLSAFVKKPKVLVIYSWWDEKGNLDEKNKEWVFNLNAALRRNGINSFIDRTCSVDRTMNVRQIINTAQYDRFIVALNKGFKKRIEDKAGVLYSEYETLLDILKDNPDKVIFVANGENDKISPNEIEVQSKIDLTNSLFSIQNAAFRALIRRIMDRPIYDNVFPLVDMDYPPESYTFR